MDTLLELHTKYNNIIKETFASDPEFVSSLDKACATIVNMKYGNRLSAKAPELVKFPIEENASLLFLNLACSLL